MRRTRRPGPWYLAPVVLLLAGCGTSRALMAINVPLIDLRGQPHTTAQPGIQDPLQETQLLYGERVRVRKIEDGWALIEAVEQSEFTHGRRWEGYPGWVPASVLLAPNPLAEPNMVVTDRWVSVWKDAYIRQPTPWRLPLGTRLHAIEMGEQVWRVELVDGTVVWMPYASGRALSELHELSTRETREQVIRSAALLIGDPYYWGGRSPAARVDPAGPPGTLEASAPVAVTGVDCSGLTNLAYRTAGIDIPRDAHEQYLRATPVQELQPGDLIFLSEAGNPNRIVHVMLYAGEGEIIEGPGTGTVVRRITMAQRFDQPRDWVTPGSVVDGQTVFFGTYLQ